ncbi:MAG: DUF1289 domain-containing protein [Rubricella sp.]
MSDKGWKREPIESPCINICVVHPDARLCIGCYRSIDEITSWTRMSPQERTRIVEALPARAPLVAGRRKGGAAARRRG